MKTEYERHLDDEARSLREWAIDAKRESDLAPVPDPIVRCACGSRRHRSHHAIVCAQCGKRFL